MVRWRSKRKVIFTLLICLLTTVLLSYISNYGVGEKTSTNHPRDFVLQQQSLESEHEAALIQAPIHQKSPGDGKSQSHLRIFKFLHSDLINTERKHTAVLKTFHENITMFIYDPKVDMISFHIKEYGTWENNFLFDIANVFLKHKDMVFLDLGCNIGVYTLFMAKLGAKVIAVDPVKRSLELLERSLYRNDLNDRVRVVFNAVSDSRTKISIKIPQENKGGAHIVSNNELNGDNTEVVDAITLDDLVSNGTLHGTKDNLMNEGDKIFMKIDIEGNEERVLVGGQAFFQRVNVIGIFMEWVHHRYKTSGREIVDVLVKNGFLPYDSTSMANFLNPDQYNRWPENVFWMKR